MWIFDADREAPRAGYASAQRTPSYSLPATRDGMLGRAVEIPDLETTRLAWSDTNLHGARRRLRRPGARHPARPRGAPDGA